MKKWIILIYLLLVEVCFSQKTIDEVLKKYNDNSVPYIYPKELFKKSNVVYIDAREQKEYNVSHIKNSIYVGFDYFDLEKFETLNIKKNKKIVVYCSLGVRSEKIAKKIISLGYTDVSNLYGGIFLWKDENGIIVDDKGKNTEKVHAYSQKWGEYLISGTKVYN